MTRDPKRPELVDQAARRPPPWSGGSRTTEARERIQHPALRLALLERRRAKIALLARRTP